MSTTQVVTFRRVCDCCGSQIGDLEESISAPPTPRVVGYQLGDGKRAILCHLVRADNTKPLDVCQTCIDGELTREGGR